MKRIGKQRKANSEYKMRSLSMLFTSKITNDIRILMLMLMLLLLLLRNRRPALNLCQFNCAFNERETQTSLQIMCIAVEHNISVFYHRQKTNQTKPNAKKSLLTQFKFRDIENLSWEFPDRLAMIWMSSHFHLVCFDCSLKFKTTPKRKQKNRVHGDGRVIKSTNIFFLRHECVCVFFLVLWLSIALPKMGSMRVSMPRNPIYALICWASLWCGKLIHIHWNTISSTYYGFLFAFFFQFMCLYSSSCVQQMRCSICVEYVFNMLVANLVLPAASLCVPFFFSCQTNDNKR